MKHIDKSGEPQSLTSFRQTNPNQWNEIHQDRNQHVYEDCLNKCISDQHNLCGYTEICLDEGKKHIDHYIKRDIDPKLTFNWDNMIAAIKDSRYGADWKDDNIKRNDYDSRNQRYNNILNPFVDNFDGRFRFSTDGTIEPTDNNDLQAINTITIFNLNENSLKACRRQVMENVRAMIDGGMPSDIVLECLAPSGFVSAVKYELEYIENHP